MGDPSLSEGLSAYAKRQGTLQTDLAASFTKQWAKPLGDSEEGDISYIGGDEEGGSDDDDMPRVRLRSLNTRKH